MGQISVEYNVGGIEGLHVITPRKYADERGYFIEIYNEADMKAAGIDYTFVQDNQSMSARGTVRGMHFQICHPQAKLICVLKGEIYDAVIDIREGSETFGRWYAEVMSEDNCRQLLVPAGFAHGFMTLSDHADILYKCTDFYHPGDEGGIMWNDPEIGIEWPELDDPTGPILSDEDRRWPAFREAVRRK